ncbi:uncharacterized protein LOC119384083 isoform X2 [Rhipicephalus sanguineus]|uniref:uncharacterized protein LOC119384083 isoform X2 n=1 Tax=Rhipicephalus sanguineus TaxID=34632 RepID=UPI0018958DA3|nr:uncharacterized protein LOC119384083 isoform X2 [Rhipicephalus sanguineus]
MDARKELDGLTFKEMRFKMCRFLEEQGVVNDLRARLRYKFVEALTITTQSAQRSSRTLLHQVILWLIQDYLSSQGYEYALCTLACESGVNQEPFSVRDVEELLRLPHCDGHSVLQRIVTRMMSRPETASAQTSVAAMQVAEERQVHAELEKLQQSVAEAEQRLLALQQQLQSAQGEETHLQTVRHMSVLTELSSVGSNCILAGNTSSSSRHTQSQRTRNSSVSSVSSLPLDRARRRLRRLSLQTDYLDDRLRAMGSARDDDQLLPSVS